MATDFDITDHGSIVILRPVSAQAREWTDEYIPEDARWGFGGVVIERRFFEPIYDGITADGLTIS